MVDKLLEKVEKQESLTKEEIIELLKIKNGSKEYYELLGIANRDARKRFKGKGFIFAQVGINASPCPANCAFCSLAKDVFNPENSFELECSNIKEIVKEKIDENVDEIFLMTTADYNSEQYLEYGAKIHRVMPKGMRLVANIGDFDLAYAKRLKEAGFTGVYHICRLGEGKDTLLEPKTRIKTLDAIRDSGLEMYYCVEPIGPEHTYEEIAGEILRGREYNAHVMAVMKRVCVPNTQLYSRGEISAAELAKICAITELVVKPLRAMGVHEPDELCLMSGANQIYAEVSANPRDVSLKTEMSRGASMERAARMLTTAEWNV